MFMGVNNFSRILFLLFLELGGGFGGVFLACEDLGRMFTIHSPPALCLFVCCKVEISLRTLTPLFTPGSDHSGSASRDDGDRVFPDELRVSSFPDRVPTLMPG